MAAETSVPSPAPPTLINTTATALDSFLKELETQLNPAINAAVITAIDAAAPALAAPIISTIVDGTEKAVETTIANYATKFVEIGATFIVVDAQTSIENLTLNQARLGYMIALKSGDPNALAQAKQNLANAQSALMRDDGSATPQ